MDCVDLFIVNSCYPLKIVALFLLKYLLMIGSKASELFERRNPLVKCSLRFSILVYKLSSRTAYLLAQEFVYGRVSESHISLKVL